MNICVVCEYAWIIKGIKSEEAEKGDIITLQEASVVRRWDNGRGIGGIAKKEYQSEYILDYIGDVYIRKSKILFEIPCEW